MNLKTNNDGLIMITVIILTIILSIIVVAFFSIKTTQVRSGQDVVDSVIADELSKGIFFKYHQCLNESACAGISNATETLDGKTYTYTVSNIGTSGGPTPYDTDRINVTVDFPSY